MNLYIMFVLPCLIRLLGHAKKFYRMIEIKRIYDI